ncbi:MAG: Holliday junction branch migration protein RuvA [bacterium]|nr:MAG: Holliday junction branch migration protein RuvA [bacterium]
MISVIEGTIRGREGNRLMIEVGGGIGLDVFVPLRALERIGGEGERVRLQVYLHVKEDALTLYGFLDENEKRLFQALLGVSGVGPKVALGILSVSEAAELARLIYEKKTRVLMSFPGIGRKTAERIVLELKDRIDIERYLPHVPRAVPGIEREVTEEVMTALMALGLTRAVAEKAVSRIAVENLEDPRRVEHIVREALKNV